MRLLCPRGREMIWLWLMVVAAYFIGCNSGPEIAEVKGTVTLDGKPLKDATVMFIPSAGGRPGTAMTDVNGRYELNFIGTRQGAMIGRNSVKISTYFPPYGTMSADGKDAQFPARPERLPKRYHEQTELSADVKAGVPSYDFDLQSK